MNKFILAAALVLCGLTITNAQVYRTCSTDSMMKIALQQDPSFAANRAALEAFTQDYVNNAYLQRTNSSLPILYTIPVVVHVIHNYGSENISKAQILDAIDILNKSFQKYYADSVLVCSVFRPIIADVQVRFRLAQLDPNGDCTDGITRTVSDFTYNASDNVKGLIDWPSNKYFNIWVVQNIASGAAGYAYMPGISAAIDGVVMRSEYMGSIGTSSGSNYDTRSLAHEAGHWLNLSHTWGGTNTPGLPANCSDDDFVFDTPNTIGVANFSCDTAQVTCGTLDNVQNYMDYAGCHYMFTEGQKARMHGALNSSQGQRNNLHSQANLIATGTDDNFTPVACVPHAQFQQSIRYICAGTTITFNDLSWNGDPTAWQWDFPGGTPSTSADQNPVIQYNTPGVYDVTLTASNSAGSNSISSTGIVVVSPATAGSAVPFLEDFENLSSFPSSYDWIVTNETGNAWDYSTVAAYSGTHSLRLLNHSGNPNGTTDVFVTPGYDLTNITNATMTFKLAFAARSSSSTDQLRVFASNNCGQNWNIRYTKSGLNLSTAGILSASFIPSSQSQWREETVNITGVAYNNHPSVRFKFEYNQNTGNNIYIDDINITGTSSVGIDDIEFLATLSVYPNPSNSTSIISFNLSEPAAMKIELTDIAGRVIKVIEEQKLGAGSYNYPVGENVADGAYFIRFRANDNQLTRKIIFTR
jgi:PKD repeat protein